MEETIFLKNDVDVLTDFIHKVREKIKELIAAWPNIEDLIKGRSMWRKDK